MITGPVTIFNWSFPREDVSLQEMAYQIGIAIREEVCELEKAGIKIIQIDEMDADVISFEASRSKLTIIDALNANNFETEVGSGVYDIHSPRIPTVEEIVQALKKMLEKIDKNKLWVNPDCGLKTRGVPETIASLKNLVEATKIVRQ
jgi:5-methyltetrahydropteroyltriglutamate--homocysteine methyltransferase